MIDSRRIKELLQKAPHSPDEPLPRGATAKSIAGLEKWTGITFPDDVKNWLKLSNGPCAGPGGFFGIRPERSFLDIESMLHLNFEWRERKWIPVAGDGCGNYYVIPTSFEFGEGFPVLFLETISSTDTPVYIVASDIFHFLIFILECELGEKRWPFDLNYVTKMDRRIHDYQGVPLPWKA